MGVASAFPMAFLSTPLTYLLLVFSLGLEWTGLCQGSWVIARVQRKFFTHFKRDEVYIGTAEERKARAEADPEHFHEDASTLARGTQALVMTDGRRNESYYGRYHVIRERPLGTS